MHSLSNKFRITTEQGKDVFLTGDIPVEFEKYSFAGSMSRMARGSFGVMLFHHFKGKEFDLWYSNYLMRENAVFLGSADHPVLELHIPFINNFTILLGGSYNKLSHHQFEISYLPVVNTRAEFFGGNDYHTFDIHLSKEILEPYVPHCRMLADFLEKVEKKQPANLLDTPQFVSLEMIRVIRAVINYRGKEGLALPYFTGLVHELLTLLTLQVSAIDQKPAFSLAEIHKAQEARKIICNDFEEYHTVEELAGKTGTTEAMLQMAFKHLYGTTVAKFSREARLEKGFQLLQETNYPIRVICMMVGYPDPANFSVAFRKQYGYWPGVVIRRKG